jgi:hypothetical protein
MRFSKYKILLEPKHGPLHALEPKPLRDKPIAIEHLPAFMWEPGKSLKAVKSL